MVAAIPTIAARKLIVVRSRQAIPTFVFCDIPFSPHGNQNDVVAAQLPPSIPPGHSTLLVFAPKGAVSAALGEVVGFSDALGVSGAGTAYVIEPANKLTDDTIRQNATTSFDSLYFITVYALLLFSHTS